MHTLFGRMHTLFRYRKHHLFGRVLHTPSESLLVKWSYSIPPFLDRNSKVLFSVVLPLLKSVHSVHSVHAVSMDLPPDDWAPNPSTSWAMAVRLVCHTWSARHKSIRTWTYKIISMICIISIICLSAIIGIIEMIKIIAVSLPPRQKKVSALLKQSA